MSVSEGILVFCACVVLMLGLAYLESNQPYHRFRLSNGEIVSCKPQLLGAPEGTVNLTCEGGRVLRNVTNYEEL